MKAVWSTIERGNNGFSSKEEYLACFALSVLSYGDQFSKRELICDSANAKLLVDLLELPFDSVRVELDHILEKYPVIWNMSKMISIDLQDEPFLHIDYDSFFLSEINPKFYSNQILTQSVEVRNEFWGRKDDFVAYHSTTKDVLYKKDLPTPPMDLLKDRRNIEEMGAYCCGLIGFTDMEIKDIYCRNTLDVAQRPENQHWFKNFHQLVWLEQFIVETVAYVNNASVGFLLNENHNQVYDPPTKFVHLWGDTKRAKKYIDKVWSILKKEFPEVEEKIRNLKG